MPNHAGHMKSCRKAGIAEDICDEVNREMDQPSQTKPGCGRLRMRTRDMKRLGSLFVLVLVILSVPSLAAGITVKVPETDIVGELKVDRCEIYRLDDYYYHGCHIEVNFLRMAGSDSIAEKNLAQGTKEDLLRLIVEHR